MSFVDYSLPFNHGGRQSAPTPTPSHSTFVVNLDAGIRQSHPIRGVPTNPDDDLNDHVTGPIMAFLYENLPLWMMSFPFSLIHWDDLRIYLNLYSTEKRVPEVIREFHITFVKLIFVEAFLVGAHKYDSILRKMNDVAPTYSKGDEEAVASLVLGELKEEEKSTGKGKKKHDESNDTRHPPLYNLRRVDDNSPRSDWVWNMFLVTELLQPGNPEFIHGVRVFLFIAMLH